MPEIIVIDQGNQVPQSISMRQARLALLGIGKLNDVEALIEAMPERERAVVRIEWEYSNEVWRHKQLVESLGAALGLDCVALDALFVEAAGL